MSQNPLSKGLFLIAAFLASNTLVKATSNHRKSSNNNSSLATQLREYRKKKAQERPRNFFNTVTLPRPAITTKVKFFESLDEDKKEVLWAGIQYCIIIFLFYKLYPYLEALYLNHNKAVADNAAAIKAFNERAYQYLNNPRIPSNPVAPIDTAAPTNPMTSSSPSVPTNATVPTSPATSSNPVVPTDTAAPTNPSVPTKEKWKEFIQKFPQYLFQTLLFGEINIK